MAFSIPLTLFVILLSFLSHEDIRAMHKADGGFGKDDVSVPQYDLRSHAAQVHDAPRPAASLQRRQQVDASNVLGDANAPRGQTRAHTHHSPKLATAASPACATQIHAAPSLLTRKYYLGWTLGMHVPAHAELELLSDIQLGPLCIINICLSCLRVLSTPRHRGCDSSGDSRRQGNFENQRLCLSTG